MTACDVVIALTLALHASPRLGAAAPPRTDAPEVAIVTSSSVEAFDDAVEGIRRGLGPGFKVLTVDLAKVQRGDLARQLGDKEVRLLVTVGNNALEAAAQFGTAPIVATMILRADLAGPATRSPAGAVVLDLALGDVLARLAGVFPGKTRAGIIRNPEAGGPSAAALVAQAKAAGVTLKVVDCPHPEKLLQAFLALRGFADFVWCPPDSSLYNGTTVKPLILASLENRLPVAGFSASFVRAGAVAGVYPDYLEAGVQAGEMARKHLAGGSPVGNEGPRKIKVAANARVARLLGLRQFPGGGADAGLLVVQ